MLPQRFWDKVDKSDGCWLWTGAKTHNGYGVFVVYHQTTRRAHRVAYEDAVGPIPEGLHLDHLCRVRHCVRPDHLEPVTNAENAGRRASKEASTCSKGHRYDDGSVRPDGRRRCRECNRIHQQRWRTRHKAPRE